MFKFTTVPTTATGDTFVIHAGTVVFTGHPVFGMVAPDLTVTSVQLMTGNFDPLSAVQTMQAVPEPPTYFLAGLGVPSMMLVRRKRTLNVD